MTNNNDRAWHLDRRVPLALIVTIAMQTSAAGWFMSSLESRVAELERDSADISLSLIQAENAIHRNEMSVAVFEEKLNAILRSVQRIESNISQGDR
ncbi:MAG: hypothetical protein ABJ360_22595 [Roseobacter sp.]